MGGYRRRIQVYEACSAQRCRGLRATVVATVVVLAVQSVAATARASCGDYLEHRSTPAHSLATDRIGSDSSNQPLPVPCHGPGCRQAPPVPMTPPAPVQHVRTLDFAVLIDPACSQPEFAGNGATALEHPLHSQSIAPLERPPR